MIVQIRQVISDSTKSIDPSGTFTRNAYPGSLGAGYPKKNNLGQYLHGLTDKELANYSKVLGEDLTSTEDGNKDPNAKVSYWALKKIPLYEPHQDYVTLDLSVLDDLLTYKAGVASGYYAPTKEEIGLGVYRNTSFYVYDPTVETTKKQNLRQKRNKVGQKLATFEKNEDWLKYVCFYLGIPLYSTSKADYMYNKLDEKKDISADSDLDYMLEVMSKDPRDLLINFNVKKAKLYKLLSWDATENEYVFNDQKFGVSDEEHITNFSMVENANNLQLLINEVAKKEKNK